MRIRIGILGDKTGIPARGWELLLQQEGLDYLFLQGNEMFDEMSAIVFSGFLSRSQREYAAEYLRSGGGVLCSGYQEERWFDIPCRSRKIGYLQPVTGSPFAGAGFIDLDRFCTVSRSASELPDPRGRKTVYLGERNGGYLCILPFDAGEIAVDDRIRTKSFYANRPRLPFERVSAVSHGAVRKLVCRSLELLHHRRNLPYVHRWYYPGEAPSVFIFRIDTDAAGRRAIEELYALLERKKISGSWFVDVKSQQTMLNAFGSMKRQEIGIHCYEHETSQDKDGNVANIMKAREIMDRAGIHARGFAAPYGDWNDGLALALEWFGFEYSSEFACDYDNLPSHPVAAGKTIPVLQIPVHPISLGMLRRQGFREKDMQDYFRRSLAMKKALRDPMIYYHHPNDENHDALEYLFGQTREWGIPMMTMGEYARWWKTRTAASAMVTLSDARILIASDVGDALQFRVSSDMGEEFLPTGGDYRLSGLIWKQPSLPEPLPADIARIRKFNPWAVLIRIENFIFR